MVGGDVLVKGAVGLAELLKIPALIIGQTIDAFGTDAQRNELLPRVIDGSLILVPALAERFDADESRPPMPNKAD